MSDKNIDWIRRLQLLEKALKENGVNNSVCVEIGPKIIGYELDFSEHDKEFEDKIAELKKDYKTVSELLGKYQQENESLKKRVVELENFSCQAEQETESLVEELKQCIAELESENKQLKHDIDKMATSKSEWIDRAVEWQQKCEKLESKETLDLPFNPLEAANYLINATYERETNSLERGLKGLPDKVNSDRYTVDDLEQIAEHLLVYCKHNKESE